MITPEYLKDIMDNTSLIVNRLIRSIVARICKRIAGLFYKGGELFIPATIADMHKLENAGLTLEEIEGMLTQQMPTMQKEIKRAFIESADAIASANEDYAREIIASKELDVVVPFVERNGLPKNASELNLTPLEIRQLESAYRRTKGEVYNITKTTVSEAHRAYIEACDNAYMQVQAGVSPSQAIADAVQEVAKTGLRYVDYQSGRRDRIEVAIARAVKTGVNQANADIILTRCAEMGINCVEVSEHAGARVTKNNDYTNHSWWQGKVYKIDWAKLPQYTAGDTPSWMAEVRDKIEQESDKYPDFMDICGYGKIQGLCGINCRHTFSPFIAGINIDRPPMVTKEENDERYKLQQKQRAMEREIAKTKQEIEALKACDVVNDEITARLREAKKKLRQQGEEYAEFCRENNLSYRNVRDL